MALRGVKASDICKATGITPYNMSRYISGAYSPKRNGIWLIAKYLSVNPVWLMGYDCPMETSESGVIGKRKELVGLIDSMTNDEIDKTIKFIKEYIVKK